MFSGKRLTRLETLQEEVHRQLENIYTGLIASDPRTAVSAEAFDGLRRNVAFAAQERRRQLSQLVAFADAIERGATIDTLRERCEQWCAEAGVQRYTDPEAQPDWFQVVDEGTGPNLEMIEPAWIDGPNSVLLKQGTARRRPAPVADPEPATAPEPATDPEPAAETSTDEGPTDQNRTDEASNPESGDEPNNEPGEQPEESTDTTEETREQLR